MNALILDDRCLTGAVWNFEPLILPSGKLPSASIGTRQELCTSLSQCKAPLTTGRINAEVGALDYNSNLHAISKTLFLQGTV